MDMKAQSRSEEGKDDVPTPRRVARGLGWFSIALGFAEIIAPRAALRIAGVSGEPGLVRLYGLREIVCGTGILLSSRPAPFLWGRVAGDGLDIASLAAGARSARKRDAGRTVGNILTLAGITAVDVYAAAANAREGSPPSRGGNKPRRDYSTRRGFPRAPDEMRGAALADFIIARDMATPKALQSYTRMGPRP
jgi:hypothetical protein